jgi:hypothetical protein
MLCGWNQTSVHGGSTACSQGKKEKKKLKGRDLTGFCPLPQQKPSDALSLFIKSMYASQDI